MVEVIVIVGKCWVLLTRNSLEAHLVLHYRILLQEEAVVLDRLPIFKNRHQIVQLILRWISLFLGPSHKRQQSRDSGSHLQGVSIVA